MLFGIVIKVEQRQRKLRLQIFALSHEFGQVELSMHPESFESEAVFSTVLFV